MSITVGVGVAVTDAQLVIGGSGPGAGADNLLLEDGFALLLETGDALLLE